MTPEQFKTLSNEGYTHIPVTRTLFADLETPLSCYVKLASGPYSYLLESANQGGEKWARFSMIGLPCHDLIRVTGNHIERLADGEVVETLTTDDPLGFIEQYREQFRYPTLPHLPIYTGGLVGYFGYDTVRYVESKLADSTPPDTIGSADILLMVSNEVVVFDSVRGKLHLICHATGGDDDSFSSALQRLDEMEEAMMGSVPATLLQPGQGPSIVEADFVSSYGEAAFKADVEKIRDYIVAGDVMQVVLSQRMSVAFEADPINLYRALRTLNPSPYMYYMNLSEEHIVSSSPEILARLDDGEVTVRPLAGTRRRGRDTEEDLALEQELLADPKERAEHLMLIDLGRNDIGRVCETGSVEVTDMMIVERYAHVMHIASNVQGTIKPGLDAMDLLRATLPVGTLSGAPKVRALEIIDELEPEKRGIFGGAVGYLSWNGNMDTAIAIRTAIVKDNRLYIQAGAGVVADSVPELEWMETMNKARSIFRAASMAEAGLNLNNEADENPRVQSKDELRPVVNLGESS